MGIIVDIIIIAIIALSTFLAYKKGIVALAVALCAFIISIVSTLILYRPIANLVIHTTNIDETIQNAIYEKANELMQENKTQNEMTDQMIQTTKNEMLPETARNLAINIVTGAVGIILFITIKVVLSLISAFSTAISKLPIIKQLNQTGGMIYGLLRGIFILYAILLVVAMIKPVKPANIAEQSLEQSILGKAMYENNILLLFKV